MAGFLWSGKGAEPGFSVAYMALNVFCNRRPGWRRAAFCSLLASPFFPPLALLKDEAPEDSLVFELPDDDLSRSSGDWDPSSSSFFFFFCLFDRPRSRELYSSE